MTSDSNPSAQGPGTRVVSERVGVLQGGHRPEVRKTLASELRQQLADEIVRGVLPPGAAIEATQIERSLAV